MNTQRYYDLVSRLYDFFSAVPYRRGREAAVKELRLSSGSLVLDLACGTGLNFALVEEALGHGGRILGLDYSQGMLRRAAARIEANAWTNVTLVQADARLLSPHLLRQHAGVHHVDALLCTLGLSVVPEWELVFDNAFALVRPGGRAAIMDTGPFGGAKRILNPLVIFSTRLVARADIRRQPWKRLEERVIDFQIRMAGHTPAGPAYVASGTKR